jgi:hypothetical protein
MVNTQRTQMRAGTALNNSLYLAPVGRVMGQVRVVPVLLITVAGRKTGVNTLPLENDATRGDRFRSGFGSRTAVAQAPAGRD